MSDWIEWHGGEQPVPDGTKVEVLLRDGDKGVEKAREWLWEHDYGEGDIVKYRVVSASTPPSIPDSSKSVPDSRIEDMKREVKEVLAKYRTPVQIAGTHYTSMTVEPIDIAYLNDLSAMQLKVLKYVLRYKNKGGVEDLKKARDMLAKAASYEYGVDLGDE